MSSSTWTPAAVSSEARPWHGVLWRMVEAQHVASTMKLVDSGAEQALLESLLETSKPAPPEVAARLDYLLATPFRYPPLHHGSRFRAATDPGVFYGAGSVHTAGAELGYWRWRFLMDADSLTHLDPVAHTAFSVDIETRAVDLRQPPFDADGALWQHPSDYDATQAFGRIARAAGLGGILYRSVRDPQPGWCMALLTPAAFAQPAPHPARQTWFLALTRSTVTWRRDGQSMTFAPSDWV